MSAPVSTRRRRLEERRAARRAAEHAAVSAAVRRRRLTVLGVAAAVAAVLVVVAALVSSSHGTAGRASAATDGRQAAALFAGLPERGGVLGDPNAPLTLTEYVDLQCPVCARESAVTLPTIVRDYVRTGKVNLQVRTLHFIGSDSERAARVAAGAERQGKLLRFLTVFYASQGTENSGYVTDPFLRRVAAAAGVDASAALAQADSSFAAARLARADADASRLGIDSTPTLTVAGRGKTAHLLDANALDPRSVSRALDAELGR